MDNEVQVGAVDPVKAKEMAAEAKALVKKAKEDAKATAKAEKEAAKAASAKEKADAKEKAQAEKEAQAAAKKAAAEAAKAAKPVRIIQNGHTRPAPGTTTAKVWDIADAISATKQVPAERSEVLKEAETQGVNAATAATQYSRWCLFHNVKKVRTAAPPSNDAPQNSEEQAAA